jgi:hypothetical protein
MLLESRARVRKILDVPAGNKSVAAESKVTIILLLAENRSGIVLPELDGAVEGLTVERGDERRLEEYVYGS